MLSLADLPFEIVKKYGINHAAFRFKDGINKKNVSIAEYIQRSTDFCAFLKGCNVNPGDRVISILGNSADWLCIEMGVFFNGAIHVPLSTLTAATQLAHIFAATLPTVILLNSNAKKKQIEGILDNLGLKLVLINLKEQSVPTSSVQSVSLYKPDGDDVAAILYTSGTTEKPKGVALTHKNIVTAISEFSTLRIFDDCADAISFLPFNHSGERKLNYSYLLRGIAICFPGNLGSMLQNMDFFKPQVTAMVPYLLQTLLDEDNRLINYSFRGLKVVCGGATLNENIAGKFKHLGGEIYEVYGLTETASLLAYNAPGAEKSGTGGKLAQSVEVSFSEDGEIWVKGDNVMKGYWKNNLEIEKSLNSNGWFRTGDIGHIDAEGFLHITGRTANSFKNTKGEFIYPEEIEQKLSVFLLSSVAVVFANDTGFLSAIIIPESGMTSDSIMEAFIKYNQKSPDALKISRYFAIHEPNAGILTDNFKLNRHEVIEKYKKQRFFYLF